MIEVQKSEVVQETKFSLRISYSTHAWSLVIFDKPILNSGFDMVVAFTEIVTPLTR